MSPSAPTIPRPKNTPTAPNNSLHGHPHNPVATFTLTAKILGIAFFPFPPPHFSFRRDHATTKVHPHCHQQSPPWRSPQPRGDLHPDLENITNCTFSISATAFLISPRPRPVQRPPPLPPIIPSMDSPTTPWQPSP